MTRLRNASSVTKGPELKPCQIACREPTEKGMTKGWVPSYLSLQLLKEEFAMHGLSARVRGHTLESGRKLLQLQILPVGEVTGTYLANRL